MPWTVDWAVFVDGAPVTEAMRPYLMDISVEDKDGEASDSCTLTFDDTGAQIRLPKEGAGVRVLLEGIPVFQGVVDAVRSTGSRGGGRTMKVSAKGFDNRGKGKEPQQFHKDDATLEEFLGTAAENAGFSLIIDPALGAVTREYWAADGESFLHLGQRLARELNATFKLRGTNSVFAKRGIDAGLPAIIGTVGEEWAGNVMSWDIKPFTGRRVYQTVKVDYFDRESATFKSKEIEVGLDRDLPGTVNAIRSKARNEAQATDIAEARKGEAEREGGEGKVTLDLEPAAQAEGIFVLEGARPGVDGTYRIVSVTQKASRNGGATTDLSVKQPQGAVGKDTR